MLPSVVFDDRAQCGACDVPRPSRKGSAFVEKRPFASKSGGVAERSEARLRE